MKLRSGRARAGLGACVVSLTALILMVPMAGAQGAVPLLAPSTGVGLVDSTTKAAQEAVADVIGGADPMPMDPQIPEPPKPPLSGSGGSPSPSPPTPTAQPSAGQRVSPVSTEPTPVSASALSLGPAQGGSARSRPAADTSAPATRSEKRGQGRGGKPSKVAGGSSNAAQPSTLQRIVQVIPTSVKVGLVALSLLLVLAIVLAMRSRFRLEKAERRAVTDALTGLPNRRHADEVVERLLAAARRNRVPLSLILFDLDRFKAINDNLGHGAGDEVLKATALVARKTLRGGDHVARFGGEEFIVILPETGQVDAGLVAEKLRSRLAALEVPGLAGGFFTASFGVAAFPRDGVGYNELLRSADDALYRAKDAGRNRVEPAALPIEPDAAPVKAPTFA